MKQRVLFCVRSLLLIGTILTPLASVAVNWPPIKNVEDEDILILRDSRMMRGDTTVFATNADVDINLDDDVTIEANDCGPSRLVLGPVFTEGGLRTITFNVTDNDLKFELDSKDDSFSIQKGGGGNVVYLVQNNNKLVFDVKAPALQVSPAAGFVQWHDTNPVDVTDTDVVWDGKVRLPQGTTTIIADTADVAIFLKGKPKVRNSKDGASTLVLQAFAGRTITLYLDRDLEFKSDNYFDLSIELIGDGNVQFVKAGS